MSVDSPSLTAGLTNEIVDLAKGMCGLDMDRENVAEPKKHSEDINNVSKPHKKRRMRGNRRGGMGKKAKDLEKMTKLQDGKSVMADGDAGSVDSSQTLSEAGTVATEPLAEPFQPRKSLEHPVRRPAPSVAKHVPVQPYYRTCAIPATSDAAPGSSIPIVKHGIFATQTIEAGARIIWEAPLITLPATGDQVVELVTAFEGLDAQEQEKIWSLSPAESTVSPLLTYMAEEITGKLVSLKHIANTPEDKRTAEEQNTLTEHFPKLAEAAKIFRLAARWHAARYSLVNLPEHERGQIPSDAPITGLFIETARLRHSCVPNCYAHYNQAMNLMSVHTLKPIESGEELTLSTIPAVYYHNATERAEELKTKFGIVCTCEACNRSHHKFKTHENMRLLTHTRAIQVEYFLTLVDAISHDHVATELCLPQFDHSEEPDIQDLSDAEATILALIKNLKSTTNCDAHPELIRWYNALIDHIHPRVTDVLENDKERLRWWRIMLQRAIECEEVALKCFGIDSVEYMELGLRREGIESNIKTALEREEMIKQGKKKAGISKKQLLRLAESKGKGKVKEEWEIVGTVVKKEEKVVKNQEGKVVGKLGTYALTRE